MKITGYKLREALKEWELRRDGAIEAFDGSLTKFADETKETPNEIASTIVNCDKAIARLQTVQAAYNLTVSLEVEGEKISLCEAVKRVGGAERIEKTWRNAMRQVASGRSSVRNRYLAASGVTQEEAKATLTHAEARVSTSVAAKTVAKLRSAIAAGNAMEIDVVDLDPSLIP